MEVKTLNNKLYLPIFTNKQIKLLRYTYKKPRTFNEIKLKLHMNEEQLVQLFNYQSNFFDYCSEVSYKPNFCDSSLIATNLGRAIIDARNRDNFMRITPMVLSIIAIIISIMSYFRCC